MLVSTESRLHLLTSRVTEQSCVSRSLCVTVVVPCALPSPLHPEPKKGRHPERVGCRSRSARKRRRHLGGAALPGKLGKTFWRSPLSCTGTWCHLDACQRQCNPTQRPTTRSRLHHRREHKNSVFSYATNGPRSVVRGSLSKRRLPGPTLKLSWVECSNTTSSMRALRPLESKLIYAPQRRSSRTAQ